MFRLAIAMMNQRRYQMYNCLDLKMCGIGKSTSELLLSHISLLKQPFGDIPYQAHFLKYQSTI
jgi:hypothetical protein